MRATPIALLGLCLLACGAPQPMADPYADAYAPQPAYEPQFAPPAAMLVSSKGGTPPALNGVWYTVQRGDFISAIATRHGVATEDVIELNALAYPEKLEIGQRLFLYNSDGRPRAVAAGTAGTAGTLPATPSPARVVTQQRRVPFIWPVRTGELVSYYGKRGTTMHKGIDIQAPLKTKIYAIADGQVIYSNNTQPGYGNLVIIRHADEVVSVYAHNRVNRVDEGDLVRQGQEIAEVGQTGSTRTPHLHFELRVRGQAQNPLVRLPATNNLNR